jgi:hypothetical protein
MIPTTRLMIGMNIIPARMMVATVSNIEMHLCNGPIALKLAKVSAVPSLRNSLWLDFQIQNDEP